MKRHLVNLSFVLSIVFSSSVLFGHETPLIICSGVHENGSMAILEITKLWHHIEPGMEPDTFYDISFTYMGENSLGFWDQAGSVVKNSISLSDQEMAHALSIGQIAYDNEQSNKAYSLSFMLNFSTMQARLFHRSGKPIRFDISLKCVGNI
ncbi:MAG: hypothetical protein KC505_04640 [Myxococcales bacterium]|nr:hypothetical protein [Myxococcales bacterium]USN51618.1 MAG: hypothetical protein H6731_04195 [Myxococcales bacterium]